MIQDHKDLIEAVLNENIRVKALDKGAKVTKAVLDLITPHSNKLSSMRKGRINFPKLKKRYGDNLKSSIDLRKQQVKDKARVEKALSNLEASNKKWTPPVEAANEEIQRRFKKSPARYKDASSKQVAKWKETEAKIKNKVAKEVEILQRRDKGNQTIVNHHNTKTQGVIDKLNSLQADNAARAAKFRHNDIIKAVAGTAGAGAIGVGAIKTPGYIEKHTNNIKTKQSEYTYEKLKNAVKACKQTYSTPDDIKKCQDRLYAKYKTSKLKQTIEKITG